MVFQNNKNLSLTNVTIREIKNSFEYGVFFASHLWEPLSECDCSIKMAFLGTFYRHFLNLSGSMTTKEMAPGIDMTCSRPFIFYSIPA